MADGGRVIFGGKPLTVVGKKRIVGSDHKRQDKEGVVCDLLLITTTFSDIQKARMFVAMSSNRLHPEGELKSSQSHSALDSKKL